MTKLRIIMIGAGNLAHHLCQALFQTDNDIIQVFSRTYSKAEQLASQVNAEAVNELKAIRTDADLYLLAVPDSAIELVAHQVQSKLSDKSFLVHCSGATPAVVLKAISTRYGVFYPLQTFTVEQKPDFSSIPFCIYANEIGDEELLEFLARKLSPKVYRLDDSQRAVLHIAAVFANNFSNHLFQIADSILEDKAIPFDLLQPLIFETARKVQSNNPNTLQTGPAIRGDQNTIKRHLNYLQNYPEYKEIYTLLTKSIQKTRS